MTEIDHCSFCGKHKKTVNRLIVGHDVAICSECVELCDKLIKDKKINSKQSTTVNIPDPRNIKEYLDQYVVGQDVDVADAFFGPEEPRFVNGVLNQLARQSRPREFTA